MERAALATGCHTVAATGPPRRLAHTSIPPPLAAACQRAGLPVVARPCARNAQDLGGRPARRTSGPPRARRAACRWPIASLAGASPTFRSADRCPRIRSLDRRPMRQCRVGAPFGARAARWPRGNRGAAGWRRFPPSPGWARWPAFAPSSSSGWALRAELHDRLTSAFSTWGRENATLASTPTAPRCSSTATALAGWPGCCADPVSGGSPWWWPLTPARHHGGLVEVLRASSWTPLLDGGDGSPDAGFARCD